MLGLLVIDWKIRARAAVLQMVSVIKCEDLKHLVSWLRAKEEWLFMLTVLLQGFVLCLADLGNGMFRSHCD